METQNKNWKSLSQTFTSELNDALQQQHHAAQFLAMVGRYLVPQQSDDSNTNMEFIFGEDMLLGNALPNQLRLGIWLNNLTLGIFDKDGAVKKQISLQGKTKKKAFVELSQNLADMGVDVNALKSELHYEIPEHQLDKGSVFSVSDEEFFNENAKYRHNAKIVLNEIGKLFDQQEPIRIWPHHFDTGAFYTISKNEKGEANQTIGIGMAIPDSMVEEPYYYLSFWSEKPLKSIDKITTLDMGKWMMPDWNGAVLKLSEIQKFDSANGQHKYVKTFFSSGIDILMNLFKE